MSALRATVRDTVTLTNPMAERALVGSLLLDPDLFAVFGDDIQEEWISDEATMLYFRAAMNVHRSGAKIAPVTVIANLPDGLEGLGRAELAKLYMGLTDSGVHADQVPALIDAVRDRWARRTMHGIGSLLAKESDRFDVDPFVMAAEISENIDRLHVARAPVESETLGQSSEKLLKALSARENTAGATTGLRSLDRMFNGYKKGQFYVIAARPAMGKSAFAISSLVKTAQAGHGVLFFSLEMTAEEVGARAHSDIIEHPFAPHFSAIMRNDVADSQLDNLAEAHEALRHIPMVMDYTPSVTMKEIVARARKLKREWKAKGQTLDVILVDHLTEIAPSNRYSGNPVMEVSENVKALRVLAKELDCCVVALCQLSREVEKRQDKKPQLSDLRWTGEIEQAAHVVAFLYREHYYLKDNPDAEPWQVEAAKHQMDFLIRKNRQGETGDVHLWCDMAHSRVRDAR